MRLLTPEAGGIFGAYTHCSRPTRGRQPRPARGSGLSGPGRACGATRHPCHVLPARPTRPVPCQTRHVLPPLCRRRAWSQARDRAIFSLHGQPPAGAAVRVAFLLAIKKDRHPRDDDLSSRKVRSSPMRDGRFHLKFSVGRTDGPPCGTGSPPAPMPGGMPLRPREGQMRFQDQGRCPAPAREAERPARYFFRASESTMAWARASSTFPASRTSTCRSAPSASTPRMGISPAWPCSS